MRTKITLFIVLALLSLNIQAATRYDMEQNTLIFPAENIASSESNIYRVEDELKSPVSAALSSSRDIDLLFYLAIALVTFLFIEWWLQTKEHF